MDASSIKLISFSVNNWIHLYSLEQAIAKEQQLSGGSLSINGKIRNNALFDNQDTAVEITFNKTIDSPQYHITDNDLLVLSNISRQPDKICSNLLVDEKVFEELRKNLMEYADIDGIHIVVTLGVLLDNQSWPFNKEIPLVKVDYAMKGDA